MHELIICIKNLSIKAVYFVSEKTRFDIVNKSEQNKMYTRKR